MRERGRYMFQRLELHPPGQRWRDRRDGRVLGMLNVEKDGWYVSFTIWKRQVTLMRRSTESMKRQEVS